jgi:hypothetical protein
LLAPVGVTSRAIFMTFVLLACSVPAFAAPERLYYGHADAMAPIARHVTPPKVLTLKNIAIRYVNTQKMAPMARHVTRAELVTSRHVIPAGGAVILKSASSRR